MKLSGTVAIAHPVADVYAALTDPVVLQRTLPGCQRLVGTGAGTYQAMVEIGVGSVQGLLDADLHVSEVTAPDSFILHVSGTGAPGTVDAIGHVRLVADPASGGTLIHYAADATLAGAIGRVGQRVLTDAARGMVAEFLAAVDHELWTSAAQAPAMTPAISPGTGAGPAAADVRPGPTVRSAAPRAGYAARSSHAPNRAPNRALQRGEPRGRFAPGAMPRRYLSYGPADPQRHRVRELVLAASFGAGIALLGVLIGAVVAGW
ncbi:MAG TPA: carbon monoxide dehydrogenase subunit G [Micromonosporaceae bacterium]|jgi:hypothetical protein